MLTASPSTSLFQEAGGTGNAGNAKEAGNTKEAGNAEEAGNTGETDESDTSRHDTDINSDYRISRLCRYDRHR